MTDPLAKWQASDLRDEMIEKIMPKWEWWSGSEIDGDNEQCINWAAGIADAILELLARSDVGSLPDEGEE